MVGCDQAGKQYVLCHWRQLPLGVIMPATNVAHAAFAACCRWQLPLGVIVRPMADEALGQEVPVIPLGSHGIVRCRRCRTYMNPFCQWVDGGRRFKCNVCVMLNEVPIDYFSTLDQNGVRYAAA